MSTQSAGVCVCLTKSASKRLVFKILLYIFINKRILQTNFESYSALQLNPRVSILEQLDLTSEDLNSYAQIKTQLKCKYQQVFN